MIVSARKRCARCNRVKLVADDATNTVYISGIGKGVIWVVDGENIKLKTAIQNTGKMSTGLALDSKGKRLYTTNADGELITIDTADNKILSRKSCWMTAKSTSLSTLALIPPGSVHLSPILKPQKC